MRLLFERAAEGRNRKKGDWFCWRGAHGLGLFFAKDFRKWWFEQVFK